MGIENLSDNIIKLNRCLHSFRDDLLPNELAHISITGKNESFIRDKLMYYLSLEYKNYAVSREYSKDRRKVDICILDKYKILEAIELKSWYSHDVLSLDNKVFLETEKDFIKMNQLFDSSVLKTAIIIFTHIRSTTDSSLHKVVKYQNVVNKHIMSHGNTLINDVDTYIRNSFEKGTMIKQISIDGGCAYNTNVDVNIYIIHKSLVS
ncbi:hypothetical protein [Paenibacillus sp. FSL H8-0537]|uniref:hypothetical protein n=1 Tax=Paenibacillus sp. FSL H8-0537 TaxID=2921399 RepID=UPI003100ABF0